jgi:hypothetical protein
MTWNIAEDRDFELFPLKPVTVAHVTFHLSPHVHGVVGLTVNAKLKPLHHDVISERVHRLL